MKSFAVLTAFCLLWVPFAMGAGEDPNAYKERANTDVRAAEQIMRKADELLNNGASADNMRAALPLYIKAGQMFEEAAGIYKAIMPNYATELDVNNAQQAMRYCLTSIAEIKKRL